jgi:hypothetical protein
MHVNETCSKQNVMSLCCQVFGGRTAVARDNSLWSVSTEQPALTWNRLIESGSSTAPPERQSFATLIIRSSLLIYGGQGIGNVPLSSIILLDLCKTGGCGTGFDSTCSMYEDKRGICAKCQSNSMCCSEATLPPSAEPGLCSDVEITLSSCSVDTSMWSGLVEGMANMYIGPDAPPYMALKTPKINFGNSYAECIGNMHSMCREASLLGTTKESPLLCSRPFMCSRQSAFLSSQISPKGVCGVQGSSCPAQGSPNNILCCSYLEHLVNSSCAGLTDTQLSGLAMSKFSECSTQPSCISPPLFQISPSHVPASQQQPLPLHMAATAVVLQSMYMLGGYSANGQYLDTFWRLDAATYPPRWVDMTGLRGAPEGGRRGAAMASIQAMIVMFGGEGPKFLYEDAFLFDTDTRVWTDVTYLADGDKPTARSQHAMTGVGGSKAYLFGGQTNVGKTNDLYGEFGWRDFIHHDIHR